MTALEAAQAAADQSFNDFLTATRAGAASHVPNAVVSAAQKAYALAGGRQAIAVCGHGNMTHPVCGVTVYVDASRQAKLDLAAELELAAQELREE